MQQCRASWWLIDWFDIRSIVWTVVSGYATHAKIDWLVGLICWLTDDRNSMQEFNLINTTYMQKGLLWKLIDWSTLMIEKKWFEECIIICKAYLIDTMNMQRLTTFDWSRVMIGIYSDLRSDYAQFEPIDAMQLIMAIFLLIC